MSRRVISITGSRADYGLMQPVHRAIAQDDALDLQLIVTGMHLLPEFAASLAEVSADGFGRLHEVPMLTGEDTATAMATSVGRALEGIAAVLAREAPDVLLLQGDRGEMLAGAVAAAHMNVAAVHMSGGDVSGSVDDSVRNAVSKLAHFHLTNSAASTKRLIDMGERFARILTVGEPGIDRLLQTEPVPLQQLADELGFDADREHLIATLHPVTDEAECAAQQMEIVLSALAELGMQVVFTYPNSDHGGPAMQEVLESWRGEAFLHIAPTLGSDRYLNLLRHAVAVVGNSSSGIYDTPSLRVPAINIGTRQDGRLRADNVIDVPFDQAAIVDAVRFALTDPGFRRRLAATVNPHGDGRAAERTVAVLKHLKLGSELTAKWKNAPGPFLPEMDIGLSVASR